MQKVKIQSEFLFIGRGDDSFLENYSYELSDERAYEAGKIFMSLEISNNQAEAEDIAETIFSIAKDVFYEDLTREASTRFEDTVKAINGQIATLRQEKVSHFIGNLHIVIAALCRDQLYLTVSGDGEAYLVRHRYVSIISEGLQEEKNTEDAFSNIANGTLEHGDMVVFSSSRLLRYITKNEFGKIFSVKGDVENALPNALSGLQDIMTTEILGRVAVIGIFVSEKIQSEQVLQEEETVTTGAVTGASSTRIAFNRLLQWGHRKTGGLLSRFSLPSFNLGKGRDITKDRVLIALALVIVLLLGGIFWLRTRGNQTKLIGDLEAKLTHVQEVIHDAATQGQFDKERGAALLATAEQEALAVLNSRFLRAKASTLLDEINRQRGLLDNVKSIAEPQLFADLTTKKPDIDALGFGFLKDRLIVFESKTLYEVLLSKIQDPVVINETEDVILAAPFADRGSMVFLTHSGKLIEYSDSLFSFMDTPDGTFKKGVTLRTYNDKVYILDSERNQLWRYKRRRDAYDAAEAYNTNNAADLSQAVSFAIDSSIYLLNRDGTIALIYSGAKQDFVVSNAPLQPIEQASKIYTESDLSQLFVLEAGKNRVLVYTKDFKRGGPFPSNAVYTTQYVFQNIDEIHDLYVSRDENKLYVLTKSKIYVTSLN